MIASINKSYEGAHYGRRKCPRNGMWCFSLRCQMGMCQRVCMKTPTKVVKKEPSAGYGVTYNQNGSLRCPWSTGTCSKDSCFATGICERTIPVKVSKISEIEKPKLVSDNNGLLTCPRLKGKCGLKACLKNESCVLEIVNPTEVSKVSKTCPSDPNGPLCSAMWCNTRGKCAIQSDNQILGTQTSSTESSTPMARGPYTNYSLKKCHEGLYKIGQCGLATIWVGREAAVSRECPEDDKLFSLIICLIQGHEAEPSWLKVDSDVNGNNAARNLLPDQLFRQSSNQIPYLYISWPDYGIPNLERAWWDNFISALSLVRGHVAMFCLGGHGRTGTAASILAARLGWVKKGNCPVTWLRSIYCDNAVESDEQAEYIEEMCPGWKVYADCSSGFGFNKTFDGYPKGSRPKVITVGKKPTKHQQQTADPTKLSKNRFKKWAKNQTKRGFKVPSISELDDGEMIDVDGRVYRWCRPDQKFEYLGVKNPIPEAEKEPEKE